MKLLYGGEQINLINEYSAFAIVMRASWEISCSTMSRVGELGLQVLGGGHTGGVQTKKNRFSLMHT